jgi:hypothetical protein
MQDWKFILIGSVLGTASFHAAACFTVYDRIDRVVYQSQTPPVDMSRPLHETLPAGFHMIFDAGGDCPVISSVASGNGGRDMSSTSPLLTDQRTARAMRLPYTVLQSGVALVQPRDAAVAPGISVIPGSAPSSAIPSTAVMGARPEQR